MRSTPLKFAALLLTLCFGLLLPTHNHAHYQVCDDDGQPVCGCDDDGPSCQAAAADRDHGGPLHHGHHAGHHCSLCESFASFAYVTAAPPHLTSLELLSVGALPRPPTPYVERTARTHLGRDPPARS
jgi:hypothetical protein